MNLLVTVQHRVAKKNRFTLLRIRIQIFTLIQIQPDPDPAFTLMRIRILFLIKVIWLSDRWSIDPIKLQF